MRRDFLIGGVVYMKVSVQQSEQSHRKDITHDDKEKL